MADDATRVLSYCIVNTNGRELLLRGIEAIRRTHPAGLDHEILVLDNASVDGSAEAVRALEAPAIRLIERTKRHGKAENDSLLLQEARGEYALLLNEDSELQDGAAQALVDALEADPGAGVAAAQLLSPDGTPQPCAWRLPGVGSALAGALFLHRLLTVQSRGERTRRVGWAQSSAMLVRRSAAEQVGWLDPDFFVYSDETDFCKRLADAGHATLYVPSALAVHHEQLSTDLAAARRRIVEFHRNRDLYMRKHHGRLGALAVRLLTSWAYALRAFVALVMPGRDPRRFALHARQALFPGRGEGLREAAAHHNAQIA